jgi:hypothetical protein
MIFWSWPMLVDFHHAYLNLIWLHDFIWLPSSHPNAMKFYMYTMLDVRIECDLFHNFWKCLSWLLNEVFAVDFCMLPLLCFAFFCIWNDFDAWYKFESNCVYFPTWLNLTLIEHCLLPWPFSFIFDPRLVLVVFWAYNWAVVSGWAPML